MVRVTDTRMSGTSFGTVLLHAAPEAAVGGPLALVRDGDLISMDVPRARSTSRCRRRSWPGAGPPGRPRAPHLRGWPPCTRHTSLQAPDGCDLDFLPAPTPAHRRSSNQSSGGPNQPASSSEKASTEGRQP